MDNEIVYGIFLGASLWIVFCLVLYYTAPQSYGGFNGVIQLILDGIRYASIPSCILGMVFWRWKGLAGAFIGSVIIPLAILAIIFLIMLIIGASGRRDDEHEG